IRNGSSGVTVGGTTAAERNVISGNAGNGIFLFDGANNNTIQGNYLGTNVAGTAAVGNGSGIGMGGIFSTRALNNTTRGSTAAAGNVISGNTSYGINLDAATTVDNVIQNNIIGKTADGSADLLNGNNALEITNGATLKGTGAVRGNVLNEGAISPGLSPG